MLSLTFGNFLLKQAKQQKIDKIVKSVIQNLICQRQAYEQEKTILKSNTGKNRLHRIYK